LKWGEALYDALVKVARVARASRAAVLLQAIRKKVLAALDWLMLKYWWDYEELVRPEDFKVEVVIDVEEAQFNDGLVVLLDAALSTMEGQVIINRRANTGTLVNTWKLTKEHEPETRRVASVFLAGQASLYKDDNWLTVQHVLTAHSSDLEIPERLMELSNASGGDQDVITSGQAKASSFRGRPVNLLDVLTLNLNTKDNDNLQCVVV
jgi:hypothetical protein